MNPEWQVLLAAVLLLTSSNAPANDPPSSPSILWRFATNDFRIGVIVQEDFKKGGSALCQTVFYIGTTNHSKGVRFYCPNRSELFMARLFSAHGEEVEKTALAREFGQEPPRIARITDRPRRGPGRWRLCMATPLGEDQVVYFNIRDHFLVKRSGDYELRVELRLYQTSTNGILVLLKFPITTPVHLQASGNLLP